MTGRMIDKSMRRQTEVALIRYAVANAANVYQTSASARAALLTERPKRMPLPVTPERQRSPSPTSSQSEDESDSDSEIEQTDSEWSPVMDRYSSADYDPALYATSEVDDAEDFYDADPSQPAVTAGAQHQTSSSSMGNNVGTLQSGANTPVDAALISKINAEKLQELRAKLLANRQATPVKDFSTAAAAAAAKTGTLASIKTESQSLSRPPSPALTPKTVVVNKNKQSAHNRPTAASMLSQSNSIDALLAESHASVMSQGTNTPQQKTAPIKQQYTTAPTPKPTTTTEKATTPKLARSPAPSYKQTNTTEKMNINNDESSSTAKSPETPNQQINRTNNLHMEEANTTSPGPAERFPKHKTDHHANAIKSANPLSRGPLQKTSLSLNTKSAKQQDDDYFKDVDLWLTITGFHDKTFREQKLKTYKMRAALEEKRRALEHEFAELERQEAATANDPSSKDFMRGVSAAYMPPPALPASTSNSFDGQSASLTKANPIPTQPASAGVKRPRSPSFPVNDYPEKLHRLNTSGRAVRRDDLFDKPLSATASRRGSDQRSHYINDRFDRPERDDRSERAAYHQRANYDTSPTSHSISVRGQAYRPNDGAFGRRDSWNAPRSPERSARPQGWSSTAFSDVNEAPLGGSFSGNNKSGYTPSNPRAKYNR
ncbi:hypothetical protein D6C97_04265 [Aureobasidium pullulans]|nr:hypothetical protein D6C97_04265 [Aureobasidium pullulans]